MEKKIVLTELQFQELTAAAQAAQQAQATFKYISKLVADAHGIEAEQWTVDPKTREVTIVAEETI